MNPFGLSTAVIVVIDVESFTISNLIIVRWFHFVGIVILVVEPSLVSLAGHSQWASLARTE